MKVKRIPIKSEEGMVLELTRQGIFTRIFEAAQRVAITPELYKLGLSEIRRYMMDVTNDVYAGFTRYMTEQGHPSERFPETWSREFEVLIGMLIPFITPDDISRTGIQQRELYVLGMAEEYRCRLDTWKVIRLATHLDPRWLVDSTVAFRSLSEVEAKAMLSGALDYQSPGKYVVLLSYILKRLEVDMSNTYSREFTQSPGSRMLVVTLNPNSGTHSSQWILDYTLATIIR